MERHPQAPALVHFKFVFPWSCLPLEQGEPSVAILAQASAVPSEKGYRIRPRCAGQGAFPRSGEVPGKHRIAVYCCVSGPFSESLEVPLRRKRFKATWGIRRSLIFRWFLPTSVVLGARPGTLHAAPSRGPWFAQAYTSKDFSRTYSPKAGLGSRKSFSSVLFSRTRPRQRSMMGD